MIYIGIDIGSTSAKTIVMNEEKEILYKGLCPTGWSSVDTAEAIRIKLKEQGFDLDEARIVATGYGRVSVPYAHKTVTEITCHGRGAAYLFAVEDAAVIDIGGQDTKIILLDQKNVSSFVMNDKCSAGTGRFLEVMANTMAMRPDALCELARKGAGVSISSLCTVFAESEVISLIGRGEAKENIAYAVVDSIAEKVVSQTKRLKFSPRPIFLTGGLCECDYLRERISARLQKEVLSHKDSRYAGAMGAALSAWKQKK